MNGLGSRESVRGDVAVAARKYLKILVFCRFLKALRTWLGGRESLAGLLETPTKTGLSA